MAVFYGIGWVKTLLPDAAVYLIGMLLLAAYVGLMWVSSPPAPLLARRSGVPRLPVARDPPTLLSGLHFLLSVVVLVWCLMVEQISPALSAFWATMLVIFVMLTQRPLLALAARPTVIWARPPWSASRTLSPGWKPAPAT
jgi:TRAP-type uncharacterized transport system fused permease subunit